MENSIVRFGFALGNMLMAGDGMLEKFDRQWIWRFQVRIPSLMHEPWGPIGTVDDDAAAGDIINKEQTKTMLTENGPNFNHPL